MTDIDIEAIRKRAEVSWRDQTRATLSPFDRVVLARYDVGVLLSHIAALEAAHEAELLEFGKFAYGEGREDILCSLEPATAEEVLTAYRAQKEKKDA